MFASAASALDREAMMTWCLGKCLARARAASDPRPVVPPVTRMLF